MEQGGTGIKRVEKPSTCVCSVGHNNEKAVVGDAIRAKREMWPKILKSSKIPISACLACSSSIELEVTAKPNITAMESEK